MTECPPANPNVAPSVFVQSRCRRDISPLAVELICDVTESRSEVPADSSSDGERSDGEGEFTSSHLMDTLYHHHIEHNVTYCAEHEICVDGYGPEELWNFEASVAYCVSTKNFVEIAAGKVGHAKVPVYNDANPDDGLEDMTSAFKSTGIEAVLTAPNHNSKTYASRMRIQAQTYGEAFHTQLWHTLPNGTERCHGCASLDLKPLPAGTKRVSVDIMLSSPSLAAGGLLYLFHINTKKHP